MKHDDENKRIIITKMYGYNQTDAEGNPSGPQIKPINKWVLYLTIIPIAIVMITLGAFFFAAFLAIFAIAAVVIGARIWWLRRKYQRQAQSTTQQSTTEEGEYTIIDDAEFVDTEKDSSSKRGR